MNRSALILTWLAMTLGVTAARAAEPTRPNILWITCEDITPHLGCYGDKYAVTPNLDRLAEQSVRYTNAFAPIGVCAPSRSCLITGMYPPSIGTQHMRCQGTLPATVKCYSQYLREAGYFCTNNAKTDYNFPPPKPAWDELSNKAHWRHRKAGQPFFAVFNILTSHESQIRISEKAYQKRMTQFAVQPHDPAKAPLPPYHPDTPEVRKDWARYADMITVMDKEAAALLKELDDDGRAEDTIVFFYSDHGAGMPRSKRWLYDSSLRVPFLVRFPNKFAALAPGQPGSTTERLVSFVDFGPTALSLAGVKVPEHMQGKPFLGTQNSLERDYVFGFRDRMDERYDLLRAVHDKRYKYIRNYRPDLPWFRRRHIGYMYEMPTMRVWQQLADAGKLTGPPALFMARTKPTEELYDTVADPFEINNLASAPAHQEALTRLRKVLHDWQAEIIDLGFLPEADLRTRFGTKAPYEEVRRNPARYPYARVAAAADLASQRDAAAVPKLVALLRDDDPAVRWWAAIGLGALGDKALSTANELAGATQDKIPWVRVAAADALCSLTKYEGALPVLMQAMTSENEWVRLHAINVLDRIGERNRPALEVLRKALKDPNNYVVRVAEHAVRDRK